MEVGGHNSKCILYVAEYKLLYKLLARECKVVSLHQKLFV